MGLRLPRLLDTIQLLNQIETAEALAAFHTRTKDLLSTLALLGSSACSSIFRGLSRGALSGPAARPS